MVLEAQHAPQRTPPDADPLPKDLWALDLV